MKEKAKMSHVFKTVNKLDQDRSNVQARQHDDQVISNGQVTTNLGGQDWHTKVISSRTWSRKIKNNQTSRHANKEMIIKSLN